MFSPLIPDSDLELRHGNLNLACDTSSLYAVSFCEISSNLLQQFLSYGLDTIKDRI